ncbi:hypothetical protein L873DRAFT_1793683 [Choiromyces venosus 120613-1]|uniref:Uncharacterized protein n=1 Tax=Choiromyces venosus 120613-1 TaxID=1336337 RepID=A0A3N4J7X5_9PEZI|nr:hypothetical protein L873DRAFT_1793683 [Choiromyces venosus 120613-1]
MAIDIATTKMQRWCAEIKIAKDGTKDHRIISQARVITGAEALEAMQKANTKKKYPAETTAQSQPTTPYHTPQHNSTPSTRSTIHVTPFTMCHVFFNLSTPFLELHSLPRPVQHAQKPSKWDLDASSLDEGTPDRTQSNTEESGFPTISLAGPPIDLQLISLRLHQVSLHPSRA